MVAFRPQSKKKKKRKKSIQDMPDQAYYDQVLILSEQYAKDPAIVLLLSGHLHRLRARKTATVCIPTGNRDFRLSAVGCKQIKELSNFIRRASDYKPIIEICPSL